MLDNVFPINFQGEHVAPIGSAEHPFAGSFDGNGRTVDNFKIVSTDIDGLSRNIGLFGYVGASGSITNLAIGSAASIEVVRTAPEASAIENVGMVAGYCGGTISGCSNNGSLSVRSAAEQKSKAAYLMISFVGGVAGQCVYKFSACSFFLGNSIKKFTIRYHTAFYYFRHAVFVSVV